MKLRPRHLLTGLALGCAILILLTPVGPWLAAELGQHLAPGYGWRLDIDRAGGRLLGTVRFEGVRLASTGPDAGTSVTIRALKWSPWSYTVAAESPHVQVTVSAWDSSQTNDHRPGPAPLPIDSLPDITVTGGRFRLEQPDGSKLTAEAVDLTYRAAADSGGVLELASPTWTHSRGTDEGPTVVGKIKSRLILAPTRITAEELRLACQVDSLSVQVDASGRLEVRAGWPLRAEVDLRFAVGDTIVGESRVLVEGDLNPLHLGMHLNGQGGPAAWGPTSVAANIALRPDTVSVNDLVIDLLDGQIEGSGSYLAASGELTLDLQVQEVELERWTGSAMGGRLGGSGRLRGKLADRQYRAELDLGLTGLRLAGKPFDFAVVASLEADNKIIIAVESTLGHVKAEGELDPHGTYDLTLDGTMRPESLLGRPSAPVRISGQVQPEAIDTQLSMERLPLAGRDFGPLQLDLTWRDPILEARLALEGDQLAIQLSIDATTGRLDTLVTVVQPLAMERIFPDLRGTVSGQLGGNGIVSATEPRLSGRLEFSDTAYKGWHTGPLSLQLAYDQGRAQLTVNGDGITGHAYLDSLAVYGGDLQLVNCRLHYLDTTEADTVVTLSLSGASDWTGRLDSSTELEAAVNLGQFELNGPGWQVAALQPIDARLADRSTQLQRVEFSTPVGTLTLGGTMGTDSLDVVADMPAIDLSGLDGPWQGVGKAGIRVHGALDKMRGTGFVQLAQTAFAESELGDVSFKVVLDDSLSATFRLDQPAHPGVELSANFVAPTEAFLGDPSASLESPFRLGTMANQLDLAPLLAYALADSVHGVLQASGDWQGSIRPGGKVSWAQVAGALSIQQLEIEKPGLTLALASAAQVRLDNGAIQVDEMVFQVDLDDGVAVRAGGEVTIDGFMHASDANDLSLVVDKLDLEAIELLGAGTLPQGTIDLAAGLTGTGEAPQLEATFFSELTDFGELEGSLLGDSSTLEMALKWYTVIGDEADLTASLPWNWTRREFHLDQGVLKTSSEGINLLMFLDQLPQLEDVDGVVALDLNLRSFDAGAEIFGSIRTSDLYVRMIDVKPGYLFPEGEIQFAGKRGELKGFVGGPEKGKGTAEISGYVEWEPPDGIAYALKVDGEDMPFNYDDVFDVPRIDVSVTMASTETGARISGSVGLEGVAIDLPLIDLNAPPVPPPPPAVQDPFLQGMELDLQLNIRDLHVENEIANVEAEGSIRVYGTFYKPLFQGEVLINEGKVFVLNNEFDFLPGRISLDRLVPSYSILEIAYDPLLLNPELDLGAVTTITPIDEEEDITITFLLQGPARQLEPRFQSESPMDDRQLLMLVAFGSRHNAMALFGQENRGALYSAAGQLLLSRQVKKIGLDEFQLLTSGTILETVGQPSVHVGKYVKWPLPLWLRYEGLTNDMSLGELRLEYKVRPYLTVTGTSQSEKERYGLGLGIEKDF